MDSVDDTAEAVGCPIRKSTDHGLLAAPHGLSQRAASFIASQCQGIHQMPFRRLIYSTFSERHAQGQTRTEAIFEKMHHDPTAEPPFPSIPA
jgi:hypothetical protein